MGLPGHFVSLLLPIPIFYSMFRQVQPLKGLSKRSTGFMNHRWIWPPMVLAEAVRIQPP